GTAWFGYHSRGHGAAAFQSVRARDGGRGDENRRRFPDRAAGAGGVAAGRPTHASRATAAGAAAGARRRANRSQYDVSAAGRSVVRSLPRLARRRARAGRSVPTLVRTSNSIWLGREVESGDAFAYEGNPLAAFWLRSGGGRLRHISWSVQLVSAWRVGSIQVL